MGTTAIWEILHEEGFARLPRRQDAERPATLHPTAAAVADCREFTLAPRRFSTQLGGLFLFLPLLVDCDLPGLVRQAGYPGSKMSKTRATLRDTGPSGMALATGPEALQHRAQKPCHGSGF